MYPNAAYDSSSAFSAIFAAGGVAFVFWLAFVLLGFYISYRILRAAVRNGVVDALKKTGFADQLGNRVYPPAYAQTPYGAPPAPSAAHPAYYTPPRPGQ